MALAPSTSVMTTGRQSFLTRSVSDRTSAAHCLSVSSSSPCSAAGPSASSVAFAAPGLADSRVSDRDASSRPALSLAERREGGGDWGTHSNGGLAGVLGGQALDEGGGAAGAGRVLARDGLLAPDDGGDGAAVDGLARALLGLGRRAALRRPRRAGDRALLGGDVGDGRAVEAVGGRHVFLAWAVFLESCGLVCFCFLSLLGYFRLNVSARTGLCRLVTSSGEWSEQTGLEVMM